MRLLTILLLSSFLARGEDVTFMAYNLKNFLSMYTYTEGKKTGERYKPDEEIAALLDVISAEKPEIIGICEIGREKDLEKFLALLKKKGLRYPHVEHVKAADYVRHLAIISQHPIKEVHSREDLTYAIGAAHFPVRRGLLHVELDINGQSVHAMGVHFKSKRPVKEADQAEMRLKEAKTVREYITEVLKPADDEADIPLLFFYGDLNDTYKSSTVSSIKGDWRSKTRLTPLELTDSRGEYWTHYWNYQREYTVFDYIFCSQSLLPHVKENKSRIIDSAEVLTASDHRPLLVTFSF